MAHAIGFHAIGVGGGLAGRNFLLRSQKKEALLLREEAGKERENSKDVCQLEGYPQSCANAHDISLCGGSLLAYLPAKPPLKGEVPALGGRRGSVPPRRKVAAALSAAVTTTKQQETAPNEQGQPVRRKNQLEPQPLFGRGGLGERRFS